MPGTLANDAAQLLDDQIRNNKPTDVVDNDTAANIMEGPLRKFWDLMDVRQWGSVFDQWRHSTWAGGPWPTSGHGAPTGARPEPYDPAKWNCEVYPSSSPRCAEHRLPQIGPIHFGLIFDMVQRFQSMAHVGKNLSQAMTDAKVSVSQVWDGAAADAAVDRFGDIGTAASVYEDSNEKLHAALFGFWSNAREAVCDVAKYGAPDQPGGRFVSHYGQEDINGWKLRLKNFAMVTEKSGARNLPELMEYAKGQVARSLDGDVYFPDFTDEGMNHLGQAVKCKVELDGFAQEYQAVLTGFRSVVDRSFGQIMQAFDDLAPTIEEMRMGTAGEAAPANPFAKLAPPAKEPQASTPSSHPTASASTAPASSGGHYSSAAPTHTPSYSAVSATPTVPSSADLSVPPTSTPDFGTTPASVTMPAAAEPETVTIADGDRRISVQSPDGQGHVKVSIDDGSGKPKSYDMDLGGATGGRGTTSAHGGKVPADATEPVSPGDDGKVVVHDGDLTLTAERPDGMPDQVKITVDDGSGHPTTYNLDYGDGTAEPQAGAQSNPPDSGGAVTPGTHGHAATGGQPVLADQVSGTDAPAAGQQGADGAQLTSAQADAGPLAAATPPHDHDGQSDLASGAAIQAPPPGDATLAAAPDQAGAGQQAGMMGGMPMMGGGGGGGGGGDSQRSSGSEWRTTGNLFEDEFDRDAWLQGGDWGETGGQGEQPEGQA